MDHATGQQPVPPFLQRLFQKILRGDTDAISLMGTPRDLLLVNQTKPPTAIKAQFYRYQFSDWEEHGGMWWKREPVPHSAPQLFQLQKGAHDCIRQTASARCEC